MQHTDKSLRAAILELERKRSEEGEMLKERLMLTSDRAKPIQMIKGTLHKVAASQELKETIASASLILITDYVSKKITERASSNRYKRLLVAALQFGVTTVILEKPELVRAIRNSILKLFSQGRQTDEYRIENIE